MVVSSARLMKRAAKESYAIPAFNIDNLESAMAVSEIMHELRTPVIVQMIPKTLNYGGIAVYPAMMRELMADCPVDYALHLDHGNSLSLARKCVAGGFSSVMFDGSAMPFEDNVKYTKEVTDFALPMDVSVEESSERSAERKKATRFLKQATPRSAKPRNLSAVQT